MSDVTPANKSFKIDETSFHEVYVRHWEKVFDICYHNLHDVEVAKEMVQDIFKSLWERREELEITNSIERYLLRSAKFKVFEHLRNNKIHQNHVNEITARTSSASNYTENAVSYNSLKERVGNLIDTLPYQCKKVFRMSREDGLSNKEISTLLHISERAVEYHITRALATLKTNLSEYFT